MRSVAARSKNPASQKASTKSAAPSAATAGIIAIGHVCGVSGGRRRLGRDGVGAEEGADDAERQPLGNAADDAQVAKLLFERESVAGLALDRRRAGGQRGTKPRLDQALQRGFVGGARRAHGSQDPTLAIRDTLEPSGRLVRAVAGEDWMCVAIDQPGRHELTS